MTRKNKQVSLKWLTALYYSVANHRRQKLAEVCFHTSLPDLPPPTAARQRLDGSQIQKRFWLIKKGDSEWIFYRLTSNSAQKINRKQLYEIQTYPDRCRPQIFVIQYCSEASRQLWWKNSTAQDKYHHSVPVSHMSDRPTQNWTGIPSVKQAARQAGSMAGRQDNFNLLASQTAIQAQACQMVIYNQRAQPFSESVQTAIRTIGESGSVRENSLRQSITRGFLSRTRFARRYLDPESVC